MSTSHTSPSLASQTRVLVVDDNEDNADSLSILLTTRGFVVAVAYEGESALARAAADQPDVILLDIGLAQMNGLEVCSRIRSESWGSRATIIAISGWGQATDLKRSKDAGFDAHLVKPVPFNELIAIIARLRQRRSESAHEAISPGE